MNPELLLPAGDLPAFKTAVENGADAVYIGATSYSARKSATNFSRIELEEAVAFAHERSTLVYLALNTLIADEELQDALSTAVNAADCGVDAIIVQDLGLAGLIHEVLPTMPLHASTQMTIVDESAFDELIQIGVKRVILPRELSLSEVGSMTAAAHEKGLQTEMFIHGALCVSFSGQCLFSSLMGGRSGNRGACAQPCRLSYQIREDGRQLPGAACLSPKDQAAFDHLSEIRATNVDSLKIEGRMRSATYVGHTVAVYRALLDDQPMSAVHLQAIQNRLLLTFNRGGSFTDRAFSGKKDRSFLSGSTTGSHGVLIGMVTEAKPQGGVLTIQLNPSADVPGKGDFLSVRRPDRLNEMDPPDHQIEVASAPIGTLATAGQVLKVRSFHPDVLARLRSGDFVYRMNDATADQTVLTAKTRRTLIDCKLTESQQQISLTAYVASGPFAGNCASSSIQMETDIGQPLIIARAEQQLTKTGGTPYRVQSISVLQPVQLSISSLNQLRRMVLQDLGQTLAKIHQQSVSEKGLAQVFSRLNADLETADSAVRTIVKSPVQPLIAAFFHQWPNLSDPLACGADVYLLPAGGLESVVSRQQLIILRKTEPEAILVLVLPPAAAGLQAKQIKQWQMDGTFRLFDRISSGHPGIAAIANEQGIGFETGAAANIYNHLSLQRSINSGAAATCLSPELSEAQMMRLASNADHASRSRSAMPCPHRLEWPVYGRQRLMYSAFCPIGYNLTDCSRCNGHKYTLFDRKDRVLPLLLQPSYCTATILHADMVRPPSNLTTLISLAPARLRLLFFDELQAERKQKIDLFRKRMG